MVATNETVIEIKNLTKIYNPPHPTLQDINISIEPGQSVALVGANGAGKSTLIKIILGLVRPTKGEVKVFGAEPGDQNVNAKIGYLPEMAGYWGELSAQELLHHLGAMSKINPSTLKSRSEKLLALLGLKVRSARRMGGYSKGMLQRSGIAASLLKDPQLWILDEPMSGLDPRAQEKFRELIKRLKDEGKTIFISSHALEDIRMLCDRVLVLEKSKLILDGPSEEILQTLTDKYRSSEPWDEDPLGEFAEGWKL